jgi:hypothetical protein
MKSLKKMKDTVTPKKKKNEIYDDYSIAVSVPFFSARGLTN